MDPLDQLRQHFDGLWYREERGGGQVYVGRDATGTEATIALLTGPSATDPGVRNAFADVVWRHSVGSEPGRATVYAADLHAALPWAATRTAPGQPGAEQLLTELARVARPPAGMAAQPAFGPPPPAVPPGLAPATPLPPTLVGAPGSPGGFGPPPGTSGSPVPSGTPWQLIGIVGGALVVMLVAVVAVAGVRALGRDDPGPPVAQSVGPTVAPGPTGTPGPTGAPAESPEPEDNGGGGGEPALREVELVSVIGPNFSPGEETWTMAFRGWPFAFRTPGTWGCLKGTFDPIPAAEVWTCIDEGNPGSGQRVNVLLWECATTCTDNEQAQMNEEWLDEPEEAQQTGSTYFVEYETNSRDNYGVDLSHFFGEAQEGELRWMVGIYAESPPDTRDAVLKTLNDIVSQAG